MVTTLSTIHSDLYENEDFSEKYSEAMRWNLTKQQSEKLKELFLDDGEVMITGDFSDIFSSLDDSIRYQLESGISYLYNAWKSWDLILWQWIEHSEWWRISAVWKYAFLENFNFITPLRYEELQKKPGDRVFAILLHVDINQPKKSINIQPKLLEIPGAGFMLMSWMVFAKDLDNAEMIDILSTHSSDLLIGNTA